MDKLTGIGLYTPQEAAALLHERTATVRRWAFGYERRSDGRQVRHSPLIATDLPEIDGHRAITFVELVELMYVRGFRRAGARWSLIREAARVAARVYETSHPFAMKRFFADPGGIYALLEDADTDERLLELIGHGQYVLDETVKPFLLQLEFDPADVAKGWWPLGKEGRIALDPEVAFGAPIVEGVGIPAGVLADAVQAEGSVERVAWLYRIRARDVEPALRFREWLKAA